MGYKVDFDALDTFKNNIATQVATWSEELESVSTAATTLQSSNNMTGAGADNIRSYFESVHGVIIGLIAELLASQQRNSFLYVRDYFSNIDTSLHAVIKESELAEIKSDIVASNNTAIGVENSIRYALGRISDIFYVSYKDVSNVDQAHKSVSKFLSDLDEEIKTLEQTHTSDDFDETSSLISALNTFISEQAKQSRSYKSDFSVDKLAGSESFRALYEAYLSVSKDQEAKSALLEDEIKNEEQRVAALEAEREEREKKAKVFKWIVTGVCIIGAIAVTAVTGGAGAPLVVGAISAGSSIIMAGANNLADQYVEHGYDHSKYDWGSTGRDVLIAGVTGFATGAIGAGIGGAITNKVSSTVIGNNLLHSSNSIVRIGTGAVIGSVSEVGSGIVSRTAGAAIGIATGADVEDSLRDIVDIKNIATDAAIGGVGGGVDQYVTTKRAQMKADDFALDYNTKHDPFLDGEKAGIENLKRTKNNGVDFSDTDKILRLENGDPVEVKIKATGNRDADYRQAEKILKEQGVDIDFKSMRKGDGKTHVWHHLDDYDVATNETTMQFIEVDAHKAINQHTGSAKQYHVANGHGYSKDSFDPKTSLDITGKLSTVENYRSQNVDNISTMPKSNYIGYKDTTNSYKGYLNDVFGSLGFSDTVMGAT